MSEIIKPYDPVKNNKKEQIKIMFNNIAKNYDLLNLILSLGIDNYWRIKTIKSLNNNPKNLLDIATGTSDLAITAAKYTKAKITAIDISQEMLKIGEKKIKNKKLDHRIDLILADCENLPFSNENFDAVSVGFGVRNFENIQKGLKEIHRVLRNKGMVTILEPSKPIISPLTILHKLYLKYFLPFMGKLIAKDIEAYTYLTNSIEAFPSRDKFCNELRKAGFKNSRHISLTLGVATLYTAIK
ncbi:MAG: bifunctional demethylmenaquinone methyltransferase/2-methoxy-6-polyprenyl-1,4-benzoquinol methylase UbiE [Bacteroidota bacterium]|nr:bifunctional demethylmenaquinone methyltransferase/2-methoxy-6-polyprenyl-1,4-benzoquinol methylase UbiE [Bacteroidota bacterium]